MNRMVKVDVDNWYRLEGYIVPKNEYDYKVPIVNLSNYDIWYTNVEVRFQNPTIGTFVRGINYKIRKFSDYGYKTIEEINSNFISVLSQMKTEMALNEGSVTYYEPFAVTESSVICYADALNPRLINTLVILKDDHLNANITAITAAYDGPPVAMDEMFDYDNLTVTGHYNDGHISRFMEDTYTIKRSDNVVTTVVNQVGSNVFTATITYGDNTWTASFVVPGVKRVVGITAEYDGAAIAIGKKPKRKNILVVANYSDKSASTITDWTYKNGDTITQTNKGILRLYYQGFECDVIINNYKASATQLKAFYNGPKVEINNDFLLKYLTVKILYQDTANTNAYWEELAPGTYTVDTQMIRFEKTNIITATYTTNEGTTLTTNFIVEGVIPEREILYLTAEYTGPPIIVGKSYNPDKVICKAYWNNGDVTIIKDFTVTATIITEVGNNEITATYKDTQCTFIITGIRPEATTESTYSPTKLDLYYPEATRLNHRRRGPMESKKFDEYNKFIYDNINTLFNIFNALERNYKSMCSDVSSLYNTGTTTLNTCVTIDKKTKELSERR